MLYELRKYRKIVETGSLNKAGQILFISQPALSRTVKNLEDHFGAPLLIRNHRGVSPTEYGRDIYRYAAAAEKEYLKTVKEINKKKLALAAGDARKTWRFGCSTIWADIYLPQLLTFSGIDSASLGIEVRASEELLHGLAKGRYEFVLCRMLEKKLPKNILYEPLFPVQSAVFIHRENKNFDVAANAFKKPPQWITLRNNLPNQFADMTEEGRELLSCQTHENVMQAEDLIMAAQLLREDFATILPQDFVPVVKPYDVFPIPHSSRFIRPFWCGIARRRSEQAPSFAIENFFNDIRLFFHEKTPPEGTM